MAYNPLKKRQLKDQLITYLIGSTSILVIASILLIFFYLAWEALPLFYQPKIIEKPIQVVEKQMFLTQHVALEKRGKMAALFQKDGQVAFFDPQKGRVVQTLGLSNLTNIDWFFNDKKALGLRGGQFRLYEVVFDHRYQNNQTFIEPAIKSAYSMWQSLPSGLDTKQLLNWQFLDQTDQLILFATDQSGKLNLFTFEKNINLTTDQIELTFVQQKTIQSHPFDFYLVDEQFVYLIDQNAHLEVFKYNSNPKKALAQQSFNLRGITTGVFLSGNDSILLGDQSGVVHQIMKTGYGKFALVRTFEGQKGQAIKQIIPEPNQKNFALFQKNEWSLWNTTTHQKIMTQALDPVFESGGIQGGWSDRAHDFLIITAKKSVWYALVNNEHSGISAKTLFAPIWYENYPKPDYVWQSSSADDQFEPKLSISVLLFGTLKAAMYAMLFAFPIALGAAIYVAFFLKGRLYHFIKSSVETMEAIPTVIIGFLAALWLAPIIEASLLAFLMFLLLLPLSVYVVGYGLYCWNNHLSDGLKLAILVLFLVLLWGLCVKAQGYIEPALLGQPLFEWLTKSLGWDYAQRNALLIGIAMGFAIIPTIFTIAEDALSGVPDYLVQGSLALGATLWQTVVKVVIPSASPALFSAAMVGFGRGIGETMIMLMATGNTPIIDWNIFEGMRAISANIAVEIGEAEVGSSHFRVLFLTALLLFCMTFVFNTLSEVIRQRLRYKYGHAK